MRTRFRFAKLPLLFLGLAVLLFAGCTVHQSGSKEAGDEQVDIKTPFGSLKVDTQADVADTGLPVFPGATRVTKPGHDHDSANVNISSDMFGVKVAVVQFQTDQPPQKVLDFYKDKLKSYGSILECPDSKYVSIEREHSKAGDAPVTCGKEHGDAMELKVGTKERQHIVAVKPSGPGSEFSLVYVETRGKEGSL